MSQTRCKTIVAATAAVLMSVVSTTSPARGQQTAKIRVDVENLFTAS